METLGAGYEGQGKKKIMLQMDRLKEPWKELVRACTEAGRNGELPSEVGQEVETVLHGSHDLEDDAVKTLDDLEEQERLQRVETTQTPRSKFPMYEGQADQWVQFEALSKSILRLYPTSELQVLQLADVCEENIAKTVRRHTSIEGAMEDLASRYGHPHLNMVELHHNLKEVRTARNPAEIITTTETILGILEAIASLQQTDQLNLPVDSMNQIFRAVKLDTMEKKTVLDFVRRKEGVPLC